eukprot:scaffold17780_cov29-Tisochrysis_lutea.AAC.3
MAATAAQSRTPPAALRMRACSWLKRAAPRISSAPPDGIAPVIAFRAEFSAICIGVAPLFPCGAGDRGRDCIAGTAGELFLHSNEIARRPPSVRHRAHKEEILELLSVAPVVCDAHKAVLAMADRVRYRGNRIHLRLWALQESAVAAEHFRLAVADGLAKRLIHIDEGVTRLPRIRDGDTFRHLVEDCDEAKEPCCAIRRHPIFFPKKVRTACRAEIEAKLQPLHNSVACA